ncbi:MAG: glycosyltransferase [Deltaproteobacteria bacterium]|nr:glycosyltransferase [Deltaproteobacteria bacterium]
MTFNTAARLLQCLESVQETARDLRYEIFVVDNASGDDTDIQIYRNFPNVRLILNERNVSFARANNQAILLSRGRYVFVTNPDIVVRPNALQRMVEYLDSHRTSALPRVGSNTQTDPSSFRVAPSRPWPRSSSADFRSRRDGSPRVG